MTRVVVGSTAVLTTCHHLGVDVEEVTAEDIDFAIAAYREEGRWVVVSLPARTVVTAEGFVAALRQLPGEGGVFGFVSVGDEFFILAHTVRDGVRLMISDAAALLDWPIAAEAAELIGLEWDDADIEDFEAAGDVALCEDFGLDANELVMICQDDDLIYPDEQVRAIAKRLGFGAELAAVLRTR